MHGDEIMVDVIISFLIAVLMGMGIGGGGFLVIYLTLCLNFEQILAQGTNLVFFILCAVAGMLIHFQRRKIRFSQVICMSLFGTLGAWLLSHLANTIDPKIPRIMLGVLLIFSGISGVIKSIKNK